MEKRDTQNQWVHWVFHQSEMYVLLFGVIQPKVKNWVASIFWGSICAGQIIARRWLRKGNRKKNPLISGKSGLVNWLVLSDEQMSKDGHFPY